MTKLLYPILLLSIVSCVNAADGMLDIQSQLSVEDTADRLETILEEKGMTVFNRIRHSESAAKVGIELRDTQLVIFGNPKAGSPLMKCQQSMAIDLPQKALIWQDDNGEVWISYNDLRFMEKRHNIQGCEKVIAKVSGILAMVTTAAATRPAK
jgi:uncharacterized protein (DUF302 family)